MARYHFWQYIVNDNGEPLPNVSVRIYLSDSPTEEAYIFTHPSTGNPTYSSTASLQTDGNGFVECWFGDYLESSGGYSSNQKFKIEWERAGTTNGEIDYICVYPSVFPVDETDYSSSEKNVKNKLISNKMAYDWETHRNANALSVHGLAQADYTDTDNTYNKLVSNALMNYFWSVIVSAGSQSISASAGTVRELDINVWTPSGGLYYADLDHFLEREYPVLCFYKNSNSKQIEPQEVESISSSRVRVWMPEEVTIKATVIG